MAIEEEEEEIRKSDSPAQAPTSPSESDDLASSSTAQQSPAADSSISRIVGEEGAEGGHSETIDPLESVAGCSTRLGPVLKARIDGHRYLSINVERAMRLALRHFLPAADQTDPYIDAQSLLAGTLMLHRRDCSWAADLVSTFLRSGLPWAGELQPLADIDWGSAPDDEVGKTLLRWDAVELLLAASKARAFTNPQLPPIGVRHIWFAALSTREGQVALSALRLLDSGLPPLVEALRESVEPGRIEQYSDDIDAWRIMSQRAAEQDLLIAPLRKPRSGFTPDEVADVAAGAGDPLGTQADAVSLADLILLEAAEPPLAIGLFGPWGSGKSTLMRRLRTEIDRQIGEEAEARKKHGPAGADATAGDEQVRRVGNVVQIEFNAWSFMDSQNLWASLTSEIFDQLRTGGRTGAGRKLVEEVAAKVTVKESAAQAARAVKDSRQAELASAEAALEEIRAQRGKALTDAARTALAEAASALPAPLATAMNNALTVDYEGEARTMARRWRSAWAVWRDANPTRAWIAAGLTVLALAAIVALAFAPVRGAVVGWAAPILSLGSAALLAARPLRSIFAAIDRYGVALDQARIGQEREEGARTQAVDTARTARDQAAAEEVASADAAAALDETAADPAKLLTYLLTESTDIQTVRSHLGLLGSVRRCFESLDDLIRDRKNQPDSIDRIVLYIDDLDRCSAQQVVQILEAVHLMLAFKCFVVVVAIDARWLRRSLEAVHPLFKPLAGASPATGRDNADLPTPSDYLEKIFQIPFWVKPLEAQASGATESSYSRYLRQLLGAPPGAGDRGEGGGSGRDREERSVWVDGEPLIPEPPEAKDAVDDRPARVERVQLTDSEHALLAKLGPLAAKSPRAVKRLVNIYRLIRARVAQDQEATFLKAGSADVPSFGAVQLALALDAGLSTALVPGIRSTISALSAATWKRLADDPALLLKPTHKLFDVSLSANPDATTIDRLKSSLNDAGLLSAFVTSLTAIVETCGAGLDQADLDRAFTLTQRYSFRAV